MIFKSKIELSVIIPFILVTDLCQLTSKESSRRGLGRCSSEVDRLRSKRRLRLLKELELMLEELLGEGTGVVGKLLKLEVTAQPYFNVHLLC